MNYIEKEKTMIAKLKESNYELFDGDKTGALDFIGDKLDAFPKYANIVINQQITTPLIYNHYEGEELRDKIQDLDSKRHWAHERAIDSLNKLNRLSTNLGLEPFADVDTSDRYKVADFVGQYVSQVYDLGQGKTLDDVTYNKRDQYETANTKRLAELDAKFDTILHTDATSELERN